MERLMFGSACGLVSGDTRGVAVAEGDKGIN